MTSLSVSLDFDLGQLLKSGKSQKKQGQSSSVQAGIKADNNPVASRPVDQSNTTKIGSLPLDEYGYAQFNVPWSLRAAYSFYYSKPTIKSVITQNLSLSGNLTLTSKTMITFTSGYDISRKQITMTSIGISRDLHCWQMNVEWIPTGYMKSWMFTIRVKASVLADLKYERRKDFHDQY